MCTSWEKAPSAVQHVYTWDTALEGVHRCTSISIVQHAPIVGKRSRGRSPLVAFHAAFYPYVFLNSERVIIITHAIVVQRHCHRTLQLI